jgi:phenylalanyl-tRNA synthetase beta chain
LPGLLKTIANNQGTALPIQLFEVSDVILKDLTKGLIAFLNQSMKRIVFCLLSETGSRNERHLCAVFYNRTPGFETIHGLLDRIMTLVKIPYNENETNDHGYYLNNQCEGKRKR